MLYTKDKVPNHREVLTILLPNPDLSIFENNEGTVFHCFHSDWNHKLTVGILQVYWIKIR